MELRNDFMGKRIIMTEPGQVNKKYVCSWPVSATNLCWVGLVRQAWSAWLVVDHMPKSCQS